MESTSLEVFKQHMDVALRDTGLTVVLDDLRDLFQPKGFCRTRSLWISSFRGEVIGVLI